MNKILIYIIGTYIINFFLVAIAIYRLREQKLNNKELSMFALFLGLSPITFISLIANQILNLIKWIFKKK